MPYIERHYFTHEALCYIHNGDSSLEESEIEEVNSYIKANNIAVVGIPNEDDSPEFKSGFSAGWYSSLAGDWWEVECLIQES
jgi:hypothetical protein